MTISSHQIHSVLRTYGKQLRRGIRINRIKQVEAEQAEDRVQISSDAKRRMVVERVSAQLLMGMAGPGPRNEEVEEEIVSTLEEEYGQPLGLAFDTKNSRFKFNVLDAKNGETIRTIEGEEADQLNERLVDLTEKYVDRTMVKG